MRYKVCIQQQTEHIMQITNYAQLTNFIRNNAVFAALSTAEDAEDAELQLFAQRAIVDFVLENPALFAIASEHFDETDVSTLHEFVFDDVV
jgi:hypothetical protein